MRPLLLAALLAPGAAPAGPCGTAVVFATDVSNSVVPAEYRLQIDGLADALRDPEVAAALVEGQVAVAVLQWSGEDSQRVSIPWTAVRAPSDALTLSARVRALPRAWEFSDTAPAEAIRASLALLAEAPPCGRRVIDVSGDGPRNRGGDVGAARDAAEAAGVAINGIAIEIAGTSVAAWYRANLVTPGGFVVAARGHADYPRAIRDKILREIGRPTS